MIIDAQQAEIDALQPEIVTRLPETGLNELECR